MNNPNTPPNSANVAPPTATPPTTSAFAAAVLRKRGEVHRVSDGAGGYYEVAILNPGALRPKNEGGRN